MHNIKFPNFKFPSGPTPSDFLAVCEHCNSARWTILIHSYLHQYHCTCGRREREATPAEYAKAKTIIGE